MENCSQTLLMQLRCSCENNNSHQAQQTREGVDLKPLYQRFAQTLQKELQKLSQSHLSQIDDLNSQIFTLKNTVQRLQLRNKKDSEAERELRREYNILLQKLKERGSERSPPEVQVVERVKEVRVDVIDTSLNLEVARWRQKHEETNRSYLKERTQKQQIQALNRNLSEELQQLRQIVENLRKQIDSFKRNTTIKEQQIQKLNNQIGFLKNNKQVIVQTRHFFPDFKPCQKVRPQTRIQTVYVEKPVEKVVVVQVQKRVKEFIQPQRPLVNRIITCEPRQDCKCKEMEPFGKRASDEVEHLSSVVEQLQANVREYRNERQALVKVIDEKNRELNSLQTQMRLFGRGQSHRGPSTVNVTVTKLQQEKPISQKISQAEQSRATTQIRRR